MTRVPESHQRQLEIISDYATVFTGALLTGAITLLRKADALITWIAQSVLFQQIRDFFITPPISQELQVISPVNDTPTRLFEMTAVRNPNKHHNAELLLDDDGNIAKERLSG